MRKITFCLLFFLIFLVACSSNNINSNPQDEDVLKDNIENNITKKIKTYIISGQEDKPEAQRINWSKTFLDKVDIESLYEQYMSDGGSDEDLEDFVKYMTKNAPIPNDWEELVKKDIYDTYGEKVVRFEKLENDLYQVYVEIDGEEVPYVVVSSRTGYFHG